MLTLTRPRSGRMISGVAIGLAERYCLSVTLLRVFFVVTMLVSPIVVLLYLLFAIAMPDEENVASSLRLFLPETSLSPRERFERFSKRLLHRFVERPTYTAPTTVLAVSLLFLAAILELPRAEGPSFYLLHPFITTLYSDVSRFGGAIFYIAAAGLFAFGWKPASQRSNSRSSGELWVVLETKPRAKFALERGPSKMIGGVASGISRVIALDTAYIRVMLIILNVLTLGLVGVLYLLAWYLERAKINRNMDVAGEEFSSPVQHATGSTGKNAAFRATIALLLVLLAAIRIATEFRFFFFNEPFVQGIMMGLIGIGIVQYGLDRFRGRSSLWLLGGASIFFAGVYLLASAVGNIQLASIERFEIPELIGVLSLAYAAIVALRGHARTIMLWLALLVAISAAMIALHLTPPAYLAAIVRFYDFFYPIIFAGLGLWIAFER